MYISPPEDGAIACRNIQKTTKNREKQSFETNHKEQETDHEQVDFQVVSFDEATMFEGAGC